MALVLKYLYNSYLYLFNEYRDPRVEDFPLVSSPLPMAATIVFYLMFVTKWGPELMKNRKPFDLKNIIKFYNLIQIILNSYMFILGILNSYCQKGFSFTCMPVDTTNNEPYMKNLLYASYIYYLTKYIDLLDTVFFVLRKKENQITFLHVYHHAGMVFGVYVFMKFLSGSHSTMLGILNSFVHILMYSYYFITSLNNEWRKILWWKKYLTMIQLIQFGYLTFHFVLPILNNWCNHPYLISFLGFSQNIFMFLLFSDFYYKTYLKKKVIIK